jgi:hypothetical protein
MPDYLCKEASKFVPLQSRWLDVQNARLAVGDRQHRLLTVSFRALECEAADDYKEESREEYEGAVADQGQVRGQPEEAQADQSEQAQQRVG